jgi:hypothetical protein
MLADCIVVARFEHSERRDELQHDDADAVSDDVVQLARDPRALGRNVGAPGLLQLLNGERATPEGVTDRPSGGMKCPEEDRRAAEREVRVLHLLDRRSQERDRRGEHERARLCITTGRVERG